MARTETGGWDRGGAMYRQQNIQAAYTWWNSIETLIVLYSTSVSIKPSHY